MRPPLQAVVFDLDDTLYPERQFVRGAIEEAARRVLPGMPEAPRVFREALETDGFARIFDGGLERLGLPRTRERIEALVEAYRAHRPRLRLHRGIGDLIGDLRDRRLRTALITQGRFEIQWRKIEALGIAPLFDRIEVAGPEEPKPEPAPFLRVQNDLGLSGPAIAMVGDCPHRDFPAPDSLGWRTVRVRFPWAFHRDDPDPVVGRPEARSVRSLRRILEQWMDPSWGR